MNKQDALTILKLGVDATERDIKNAYYKLSLKYHQDKYPNLTTEEYNEQIRYKLLEAQDAYTLLTEGGPEDVFQVATNMLRAFESSSKVNEADLKKWIKHGANIDARNWDGETILILATKQNNLECVKILINKKANLNQGDQNGNTPLMKAADGGNLEIVNLLLESGADVNQLNHNRHTALMNSAYNGHIAVVMALLDNGANVKIIGTDNKSAEDHASNTNNKQQIIDLIKIAELEKTNPTKAMLESFRVKFDIKLEKLKEWIQKGANIKALDGDGNNVLILAAEKNNQDCVEYLLEKLSPEDIKHTNNNGDNALFPATNWGNAYIVTLLIEEGIEVNTVNKDGKTALMNAAYNGYDVLVAKLLGLGAKINVVSNGGMTVKQCAEHSKNEKVLALINPSKLLFDKLKANDELDIKALKGLMSSENFNVKATDHEGNSLLILLAQKSNFELVNRLIEEGADVNAVNEHGVTAVMRASDNGNLEIINLLIQEGADVNLQTKDNKTALMNAAYNGYNTIVKALLDAGARADAVSTGGLTVKQCAEYSKNQDVIHLIEKSIEYINQKHSIDLALIEAVTNNNLIDTQTFIKQEVNLILEHNHFAKIALNEIAQLSAQEHLGQLDSQLTMLQDCLGKLDSTYHNNLSLDCSMND